MKTGKLCCYGGGDGMAKPDGGSPVAIPTLGLIQLLEGWGGSKGDVIGLLQGIAQVVRG